MDDFDRRHNEQINSHSHKDIFTIWLVLMFLSVISAHFFLNVVTPSPTGFAVGSEYSLLEDISSLLAALGFFVFTALVGGLAYYGITKNVD